LLARVFMDLRRRVPFKLKEESEDDTTILDDQEQEELLEALRHENTKSNQQGILMMQLLVLLYPSNNDDPIPLPRPFTLVSLVLHANLVLLLDPTSVCNILLRVGIRIDDHVDLRSYTLSPTLSYTLALVAPSICLFLRRSWWTIAWWSITIIITYAVQLVLDSISTGDERITSLEAMRYRAPGA